MHRPKQSATRIERSARVVAWVCSLMRAGTLRAGDRLPPEGAIAELLKIRSGHVRDGIVCLRILGIVRTGPGAAPVLAEGPPQILLQLLSALHVSRQGEVAEARRLIAIQLAGLAAQRATQADHIAMAEEVAAMYAAGCPGDHREHALRFQQRVARSSGNALLAAFAEALQLPLAEEPATDIDMPPDLRESARMHRELYRAIRRHHPSEAKKAMEEFGCSALDSLVFRLCSRNNEDLPRGTGT
jgi:GntR family transcriptional regulator, transcriptional repressor for pyruvate dehydrogenase complex